MAQMIIANRLLDGLVVFLASPGEWVEQIDGGALIGDESAAESLFGAAKQDEIDCLIIDPALIDVDVVDDKRRPTAIREAIRAFGPSPVARTDK